MSFRRKRCLHLSQHRAYQLGTMCRQPCGKPHCSMDGCIVHMCACVPETQIHRSCGLSFLIRAQTLANPIDTLSFTSFWILPQHMFPMRYMECLAQSAGNHTGNPIAPCPCMQYRELRLPKRRAAGTAPPVCAASRLDLLTAPEPAPALSWNS